MCCGHPHGKMIGMVKGLVLLGIGILWWLTNYGMLEPEFWDWLLPLLVILLGVKMLGMPMCKCEACQAWRSEKDGDKAHKM